MPSAVEAISKEVKVDTETVISCKITGIGEGMSIAWSGFTAGPNFVPSSGSYDSSSNSQTGTLTVKSGAVKSDATYTCSISSTANPASAVKTTDVDLNVYGKNMVIFKQLTELVNNKHLQSDNFISGHCVSPMNMLCLILLSKFSFDMINIVQRSKQ